MEPKWRFLPFELNKVFQCLRFEHTQFIGNICFLQEIKLFGLNGFMFAIFCFDILTQVWQQVNLVANLVNFWALSIFKIGILWESLVFKDIIVSFSKHKDASIVWHQTFLLIDMTLSPLIKNDFLNEYVTFKNRLDRNIFVHQLCQIILQQVWCYIIILILHYMFDHTIYSCDLIAFECAIDCTSVEELRWSVLFLNFVFVKEWELVGEVFFVTLVEKFGDWTAVKRENG